MINLGKESELVEFKKSTSELNEAIISISAMLNKNGKGKVYFGVKNNGDAIGQQVSENTLRDISRKIYEDINPTIYPSINEMSENPGVIEVSFSGLDKPYSAKGKFYIRVFDEDKQIEIKELLNTIYHSDSSNAVWEKIETSETEDDIDEDLLKEFVEKANKCGRINEKYSNKTEVLNKLGLMTNNHINNAGRVLFSKNKPLTLKLAVFASDEKLSFIDINRVEGNIFELNEKGQNYIKEHINYKAEIKGRVRVETPEIPEEVIREAVLNSLCHSSFSESINNEIYITPSKVSIFNPGAFPSGYDPKDFAFNGVESILRNPIISRALYYCNEIDSWATGFRRIFKLCDSNNIKIMYQKKNQGFEISFYRLNSQIGDIEQEVLNQIANNPKITALELVETLKKSQRTIYNVLKELKDKGIITREGSNRDGEWKIRN